MAIESSIERTLTACRPFRLLTTSQTTRAPSRTVWKPPRRKQVTCKRMSGKFSSGTINPYPLDGSNHLTDPDTSKTSAVVSSWGRTSPSRSADSFAPIVTPRTFVNLGTHHYLTGSCLIPLYYRRAPPYRGRDISLPGGRPPVNVLRKGGRSPNGMLRRFRKADLRLISIDSAPPLARRTQGIILSVKSARTKSSARANSHVRRKALF